MLYSRPLPSPEGAFMIPGSRLRQTRESAKLTYRDVERASYVLAEKRGAPILSFTSAGWRTSRITGRHPVFTKFDGRDLSPECWMFSDSTTFRWVCISMMAPSLGLLIRILHRRRFKCGCRCDSIRDSVQRTDLISRMVEAWGEWKQCFPWSQPGHQYGYVGLDDHMMEPLLRPGSLVLVDPARQQVRADGWLCEFERPIYFVELRGLPVRVVLNRGARFDPAYHSRHVRLACCALRSRRKWWER